MGENQERRQARRQKRGVLRVEEILQAAGALFAELGYDKVTTNMIAARADISPGSLYQFFPNKEAIAQAFAADATEHLHQVYDAVQSSEVMHLPLQAFLDTFIDELVAFNRSYPGYLALELGSTISSSLALVLADLQRDMQERFDALLATYWPQSTREQRHLPLLVSYRLFLALLPLALQGDEEDRQAIVREMKAVLYRYWEPIIDS
ncbi:MAG: TetR/AcrR family transcriptional regulator [Ktedonobacteraceae bacterium]|nr:TetR/AcrR family transcriptional regulator [Ktedonobacteraceae bacterium]